MNQESLFAEDWVMPPLSAIVPWFGGKRTMAPLIASEIGKCSAYFELFAGSAAVLFAKQKSQQETLVDLHADLTNLGRVLQDESTAIDLYGRASRAIFDEGLYFEAAANLGSPVEEHAPVDRAFWYLVSSWQGRNGTAGLKRAKWQPSVRFTPGGGSSAKRWTSVAESIPAWHLRLREALILQRDAFEVLEKIADDVRTVIYADPPYLMGTRGAAQYLHEFDDHDHKRLADGLNRFEKARVIVSYYDSDQLDELYPTSKWTKRDCARQKNLHVQNRRGAGECKAPEVLLINGPSLEVAA